MRSKCFCFKVEQRSLADLNGDGSNDLVTFHATPRAPEASEARER